MREFRSDCRGSSSEFPHRKGIKEEGDKSVELKETAVTVELIGEPEDPCGIVFLACGSHKNIEKRDIFLSDSGDVKN